MLVSGATFMPKETCLLAAVEVQVDRWADEEDASR